MASPRPSISHPDPDTAPGAPHRHVLEPAAADAPPAPLPPDDPVDDAPRPLPRLPEPASNRATYRSRAPRRSHPYRGAVLLALVLAGAAAVAWFAAAEVLLGAERTVEWLQARDSEANRRIAATVFVTLGLLAIIVAWARATSPRRAVRLSDGRGRMAVDEIEAWLRDAIVAEPDVREARVTVENRHRHGLRVDVDLRVGPRARIDDAMERVDVATEDLLHARLGVPMDGLPLVDVSYDELDLRAGRLDASRR